MRQVQQPAQIQTTKQVLAHLQIGQHSKNQEKRPQNEFARLHVRKLVKEGLARILRIEASDEQIDQAVRAFLGDIAKVIPFDDFFFDEELHPLLFPEDLQEKPLTEGIYYANCCSVARPTERVRAAMQLALSQERENLEAGERELAFREARTAAHALREKLSPILRIRPNCLALTRNAGEAAGLAAAMAGLFRRGGHEEPTAFGDDTYLGTILKMNLVSDAGNINGRDRFSAFPTAFVQRGPQYGAAEVSKYLGQNSFVTFAVRGKSLKQVENEIKRRFKDYKPKVVVLTHVDRATGKISDLHTIGGMFAEHCDQRSTIIVDGAMAVGGIYVDLEQLFHNSGYSKGIPAIHAYFGTLGKAFGGPSVGFLAMSDAFFENGRKRLGDLGKSMLILHGMFDSQNPSFGVRPTVDECLCKGELHGALRALEELEELGLIKDIMGFQNMRPKSIKPLEQKRSNLRTYFKQQLQKAFASSMPIEFIEAKKSEDQSPLILAFRLPLVDMRALAERLQSLDSEERFVSSYIEAYDCIRIGIDRTSRFNRAESEDEGLPQTESDMYISDAVQWIVREAQAMQGDGLVLDQDEATE